MMIINQIFEEKKKKMLLRKARTATIRQRPVGCGGVNLDLENCRNENYDGWSSSNSCGSISHISGDDETMKRLKRDRCRLLKQIITIFTIVSIVVVPSVYIIISYDVPGRIRATRDNIFYEMDVSLFPKTPFVTDFHVDAIMLSLPERPAPTADRWKSLGFPHGEVFHALHHTRDRHIIEATLSTETLRINQLALIASAKRALENWLRRSNRPYVILFEDDVLPATANTPAVLHSWAHLPTVEDDMSPRVYFLGETFRCGRYNFCQSEGSWLLAQHSLAGATAIIFNREAARRIVEMKSAEHPWDRLVSLPPFVVFRYVSNISGDPIFCGLYRQPSVECYSKSNSIIDP